MANNELLDQVITHIKDHPETHNQEVWIQDVWDYDPSNVDNCGTAGCFAGWAVLLTHGRKAGDYDIESEAIRLLNLHEDDAGILFHDANSRETLELMVKDLQNGLELEDYWELDADGSGGYNYVRCDD